jgi:hypothetical protein
MPYKPIPLRADVTASIRAAVEKRIEPNLRDVRLMLEFPRIPGGEEPGFNFSAASVLFSVIGGLSRMFFSATKKDSEAFPQTAKRYPLNDEPWNAIRDPEYFGAELYKIYRCNLVHSLGLTLEWSERLSRWEVITLGSLRKVTRHPVLPLSEEQLAELDEPAARPSWLKATLSTDDAIVRLNVEALYWGVRRLVRELAEDASLRASAEAFIRPWYLEQQDTNVLSSAQPTIATSRSVEQTLGPIYEMSLKPWSDSRSAIRRAWERVTDRWRR